MIQPSLPAALAQLRALANFIDEGGDNATFTFYDDLKPTSVTIEADPNAILVTLSLPKPCFKAFTENGIELKPTDTVMAIKSGTVAWARLRNGAGVAVADFEMGIDIVLNSYDIALGGTQVLDSIIFEV